MDVPTVMLVCLKYNRIIRGFGGYCTTDLRGIVGKGGCRKFGSGRHEGIFIHGGTESGGEIYEKESGIGRKKRNRSKAGANGTGQGKENGP